MLLYCHATKDNDNQNGYMPAFPCPQIVLKQAIHIYIYKVQLFRSCFTLIHPKGSINKNLGCSHLYGVGTPYSAASF